MRVKPLGVRSCLALLATLLVAAGCASAARTDGMIVAVSPDTVIGDASPLRGAIRVGTVSGGGETNPLWRSNVAADDFRTALEQSLAARAMIAASPGRYTVNAELVSLERPLAAFDTTVTAKVRYTVLAAGQAIKLDETIVTPFTVNFSDAPFGPERLRLANEGAMRTNIETFIKRLIDAARPGQALAL
jgi:hypothetical protein